jgi:alanine racemase
MRVPLSLRPRWIEIDLAALRENHRAVVRLTGARVDIIASVKANGYGHGVVGVSRALEGLDRLLGVATGSPGDALDLRAGGYSGRIVLFGSSLPGAEDVVLEHGLTPTIGTLADAVALSRAARAPARVFVEVDCGLGRLGVAPAAAAGFVQEVARFPHLEVEGVYTHLPFSEPAELEWARSGLGAFATVIEELRARGLAVPVTQALASSGLAAGLSDGMSAVCPGHVLYGLPGVSAAFEPQLRTARVLTAIKARLIHVAHHEADRRIGRGGSRPLPAGAVTGVVPFGSSDGFRPLRGVPAAMVVGGVRAPVLGVSLEHTTLDLSGCPEAAVGDEVAIVGGPGVDSVTLDEIAAWQGLKPLDALVALDRAIPRVDASAEAPAEIRG